MNIVYFDETGNTGSNLLDKQQPIFVLVAMVVPELKWMRLEKNLQEALDQYFPMPRPANFEIHAATLRNGDDKDAYFKKFTVKHRIEFRDSWLKIARLHDLKLIYRAIVKVRFDRWVKETFGAGIQINPYVVAFPLVARVVDDYLNGQSDSLGVFVFDENKEMVHSIEKSLQTLRFVESSIRLNRIIEKGFFIESSKSLILQLCDICAYSIRKKEEAKEGMVLRPIDKGGIDLVEPLTIRGFEAFQDVIAWLMEEQKKGAARG